jgi:hypothetical protein
MPLGTFALFSLATILAASIIAGLILTFVSRDAAESGIPQVKVASWRDFGFVPARVVVAKFFAGAISIGGGCSLGARRSDGSYRERAGMSACLGAVVRAPITSILIVFEMTHQFSFVPLVMIGTIASQAVSRALCHTNFYSEIIERDEIELERHMPPRSLASLQSRPVSTLANFTPIFANSTDRDEIGTTMRRIFLPAIPFGDGRPTRWTDRPKQDPAQSIAEDCGRGGGGHSLAFNN